MRLAIDASRLEEQVRNVARNEREIADLRQEMKTSGSSIKDADLWLSRDNYKNVKYYQFKSVTVNGFDFGNLKSAIQKYIRRSELTKALQCCLEADISYRDTQLNKGEYATSAQSNRSNFINRMIVSMVEDISINGRPDLPIIVQKIYVAYKEM